MLKNHNNKVRLRMLNRCLKDRKIVCRHTCRHNIVGLSCYFHMFATGLSLMFVQHYQSSDVISANILNFEFQVHRR